MSGSFIAAISSEEHQNRSAALFLDTKRESCLRAVGLPSEKALPVSSSVESRYEEYSCYRVCFSRAWLVFKYTGLIVKMGKYSSSQGSW